VTWVRVAVHVHSHWSYDGNWSLETIAAAFGRMKFDAVLMAEHDRTFSQERWHDYVAACGRASSTTSALLVPGIEYSDPDDVVHVPVWGSPAFLGRGQPTSELLERTTAADALAVFAHPQRRDAWMRLDPSWLTHLFGFEAWNSRYGVLPDAAASSFAAGQALLVPFYALDFHRGRDLKPVSVQLNIPGGALSTDAVIAALRSGPHRFEIGRAWGRALAVRARRAVKGRRDPPAPAQ